MVGKLLWQNLDYLQLYISLQILIFVSKSKIAIRELLRFDITIHLTANLNGWKKFFATYVLLFAAILGTAKSDSSCTDCKGVLILLSINKY